MDKVQRELISKYIKIDKEPLNNYEYQLLVSKLKKINVPDNDMRKIVVNGTISNSKMIVISDTHYGLIYENYKYIDLVFDYAAKNGINSIVHCGDFIQGSATPQKQYYDMAKDRNLFSNKSLYDQAIIALERYPMDDKITTYLLMGNHDYLLLRKYNDMYDFLSSRYDVKLLGLKKAYINWCNYLINFNHRIPKFNMHIPRVESNIRLYGHRHEFNYKEGNGTILLPTLSDDLKFYGDVNYPGFVVLSLEDENIDIKFYPIINNKVNCDCLSLKKSLCERTKVN